MIRKKIIQVLEKVTREKEFQLTFSEYPEHGDYATNLALILAKKQKKNPKKVAEDIVQKIKKGKELDQLVAKIELAGPGFINFFLSPEFLLNEVNKIIDSGKEYGSSDLGQGKTVLVEYSSPNIAKFFGIGHLRSTIIGQALYNLYQFLSYDVVSENHLGDWGTQFGMIICQIKRKKLDVNQLSVADLEKLYVEFNQEAQKKPELREEAKAWFKKLEEGDREAREIWQKAKETSLKEFDRIYDLLGVKIDHAHGESFYEDKMPAIIKEIRQKKLSEKSQGAEVVELEGMPPGILLKSDGATTYFTRDLAALKYRIQTWDPKEIVYEVGAEQSLHFRQVFKTAELLGWTKDRKLTHVAHGLIRGKFGKLSTRRGEAFRLEEILEEAINRAKKIIEESETGRGLSEKEKEKVAQAVGIGAIKYFDLLHQPTTSFVFDWEKLFVLQGNSGPYLQYTFARTASVLEKARKRKQEGRTEELNQEELVVLRHLARFSDLIVDALKNYSPNLVCNYLFDLAQKYNHFYQKHPILGSEQRLKITQATGQVLQNGLHFLGIETPEKM